MKNIAVLVSTYNGGKYLREQLDSILNQVGVDVRIIVRDDGSTDNTIDILNDYSQNKKLRWYGGGNLRPLESFMHLLFNCPHSDYYAFCDQDDVWLPNKLNDTFEVMYKIEDVHPDTPVLVHTDMTVVDSNLNVLNKSFWDINGIRPDILNNFLDLACYNGVNGCTIMLNNNARELVKSKYFKQTKFIHDVFCALTVSANGGIIGYLDKQTVLYRQHGSNVVGADEFVRFRYLRRMGKIFSVIHENYDNYIVVNKIREISAYEYIYHKIMYIFTKKHGLRI